MILRRRTCYVVAAITLAVAGVACGGRADTGTTPSSSHRAPPSAEPAAPSPSGAGAPSVAECGVLLDHVLAISMEEELRGVEPDARPTDDQVADIRAALEAEFLAACQGMTRPTYDCALAARDSAAMSACDAL